MKNVPMDGRGFYTKLSGWDVPEEGKGGRCVTVEGRRALRACLMCVLRSACPEAPLRFQGGEPRY
jgi:hypothetical protein